ncbi:Transposon Tn7 transposition protein TnsB [compost metagenome]
MPGFAFRKNTTFKWNGADFRIERLLANDQVLIQSISDGTETIVRRNEIMGSYIQGNVSATQNESSSNCFSTYSRPLDELSPKMQAQIIRRRKYLELLMADGPLIFTRNVLSPMIEQAAEKLNDQYPPDATTVYRWYKKYRAASDTRSLIPRFDKRGRGTRKGFSELQRLLSEAMMEAFNASPQTSVRTIFQRLVTKIDRENNSLLQREPIKVPSLSTVHRLVQSASAYELSVLRDGKRLADKRYRIAKAGPQSSEILERVEIDHTPLDLFLIDDETGMPQGRPTLTVVVDHFSRMLLGYYLSFESPSSAAVIGALRHAILPKQRAAELPLGLTIEHEWPCYGRPDLIVVDNGLEFHGNDLDGVAYDLGISVQYCPKYSPEYKGVVERYLGTVNRTFASQLPGTSFSRFYQRGDYDSVSKSLMTMNEFKYLFEKWVVDIYAQTTHKGIGTTPWLKWHEGRRAREPELPQDISSFKRRIGKISERALRKGGIELNGIRYNDDQLAEILRNFGVGIPVRVLYDPEDLGEIQVWGPNDAEPSSVKALNYEHAKGLTSRQNKLIRQIIKENGKRHDNAAALKEARRELIRITDHLMTSRKQIDRRRSAALKGISSAKPIVQSPKKDAPAPRKVSFAKPTVDSTMPLLLPTFNMRKDGESEL